MNTARRRALWLEFFKSALATATPALLFGSEATLKAEELADSALDRVERKERVFDQEARIEREAAAAAKRPAV